MKRFEFGKQGSSNILIQMVSNYDLDVMENEASAISMAAENASPSLWFPDFDRFLKDNEIHTVKVYLSLGDKKEKTRNQTMSTVGDRIREMQRNLKEKGIDCVLEWNKGNHFKDTDLRTAKAFCWLLNKNCK